MTLDARTVLRRYPRRKLAREVIWVGQRWRRRVDGAVVVIRQRHPADGVAEVSDEGRRGLWQVSFSRLIAEFEELKDWRGAVR